MQEPIALFVTGGTLDKDYHAISGQLTFTETHVRELLDEANCQLNIELKILMLKDSLEMTTMDREAVLLACKNTYSSHIVITHGTDTMVETAQHLLSSTDANLQNKTIVLTGAMRPFKLSQSDASFNIGNALMACQLASEGVYIAMNGQLFNANQVVKNREIGVFQTS